MLAPRPGDQLDADRQAGTPLLGPTRCALDAVARPGTLRLLAGVVPVTTPAGKPRTGASADRSSKAAQTLQGGSTLPEFKMAYSYFPAIPKFIIAGKLSLIHI